MADQTVTLTELPVHETGYPYLVKVGDLLDGIVLITGINVPVWVIVESYYRSRLTVDEITARWGLHPAQIYSALTYYHDNTGEIEMNKVDKGREFNGDVVLINGYSVPQG